jgi:hypothetical protein
MKQLTVVILLVLGLMLAETGCGGDSPAPVGKPEPASEAKAEPASEAKAEPASEAKAEPAPAAKEEPASEAKESAGPELVAVTVTGVNVTQDGVNVLKVTEAKDAEGNVMADLADTMLTYAAAAAAEALSQGDAHIDKTVTITGKLDPATNTLTVESFEVAGGEAEEDADADALWEEIPIGNMSGQQVL